MSEMTMAAPTYLEHSPYPSFEGKTVDAILVVAAGSRSAFDEVDTVMQIDDRVQVLATYRCVGVSHAIDEKTGTLLRVQTLKPEQMALAPWDPSDPDDDGVLRANIPGGV